MTLLAERVSKLMTVDEFLAAPDARDFELVNGVLTERKPMGAWAEYIGLQIAVALTLFCRRTGAGRVLPADVVYRCFGDARTGRKGDVSFIRAGRLAGDRVPEGAIDIPADLVVEVVSPTDRAYDVEAKAQLYLDSGFEELWVVFPNTRTVHIRRRGEPALILGEDAILTGRGALDGFACKVSDLFPA